MINYIPTVPCGYQEKYNAAYNMDFILLHKLLDNEDYRNYYLNKATDRKKEDTLEQYWILDNSAFELGESLDDVLLVEWALKLKVDELVIPDVYQNMEATMNRYHEFIKQHLDSLAGEVRLQAVPQGSNKEELMLCLNLFEMSRAVSVIGINKLWLSYSFLNIRRYTNKPLHKLGVNSFQEWVSLRTSKDVTDHYIFRSVDSRILTKLVTDKEDIWEEKLTEEQLQKLTQLIVAFI